MNNSTFNSLDTPPTENKQTVVLKLAILVIITAFMVAVNVFMYNNTPPTSQNFLEVNTYNISSDSK